MGQSFSVNLGKVKSGNSLGYRKILKRDVLKKKSIPKKRNTGKRYTARRSCSIID